MGKGFYLENFIPIGSMVGFGSRPENLKGSEHGGDAFEVRTKTVGFLGMFESGLEV